MEIESNISLLVVDMDKNGVVNSGDVVLSCRMDEMVSVNGMEVNPCDSIVVGDDGAVLNKLLGLSNSKNLTTGMVSIDDFGNFLEARSALVNMQTADKGSDTLRQTIIDIDRMTYSMKLAVNVEQLYEESNNAVRSFFSNEIALAEVCAKEGDYLCAGKSVHDFQMSSISLDIIFGRWNRHSEDRVRDGDLIMHTAYCNALEKEMSAEDGINEFKIRYLDLSSKRIGYDCGGMSVKKPTREEINHASMDLMFSGGAKNKRERFFKSMKKTQRYFY